MARAVAAPSRARKLSVAPAAETEHVKLTEDQKKVRNAARMRALRGGMEPAAAGAAALAFALYGTPLPIDGAVPAVAAKPARRSAKVVAAPAPVKAARGARAAAPAPAPVAKITRATKATYPNLLPAAIPLRSRSSAAATAATAVLGSGSRYVLTDMQTGNTIVKDSVNELMDILGTFK